MNIEIPDELGEEFITFIEVGLSSTMAYYDELTPNELGLVQILERFVAQELSPAMEKER